MNRLRLIALILVSGSVFLALSGCGEQAASPTDLEQIGTVELRFDSVLAAELKADQYGMGRYVMAFLKSGPNPSADSAEAAELQQAHLANIRRMAEEGELILAGPFMDRGEVRGIYIFDVGSLEEARALTETDPAIQAGALEMELRPWYGSAALRKVNEIHGRIALENP